MKRISTEAKVGVFMFLGILVLAYMTVNIEKFRFGGALGYNIYTRLESAAGLLKKSPVKIAGVQVGRVEEIILENSRAKVTLRLPLQMKVPVDSLVFVKSEGLLGEKYIEIKPGRKEDTIKPNSEIYQGESMVDIDHFFNQMNSVASDIKRVTVSLNRVFGGKEGERSLKNTFDSIEDLTADLSDQVRENKERFNRILAHFEGISDDLAGVSENLDDTFDTINTVVNKIDNEEGLLGKLVADKFLYDQTIEAIESLHNIALKIERGEGTIGSLVADKSLYDEGRDAIENLKKITKRIERGEGALGKLTSDDTLYTEAKKAIKNMNKAAEGIQEQTPVTVLGTVLGIVLN